MRRPHTTGPALGLALLLLAALPASAAETAVAEHPLYVDAGGSLEEFDSLLPLPPAGDSLPRFVLGDVHGFVHVYERHDGSWNEVWLSDYLESSVSGLFIADIDRDDLPEILAYTEAGRIHVFDAASYQLLWSNPPGDYTSISAMTLHNVDDDEQPELLFVADGRLHIYDGRDRFEEWRSDQDNIRAAQILVGDVDGDGSEEIVLNDGFVFDARYRDLEWQSPESFGERMGLLDVDDDRIPEVIGEFQGRFLRIFDIDLRR
jgi:hypothetical protein